ncbi:hypothetical protein PAB09_02265 [Corynebacterium sp. SCR221107]|uniref:hypothetical protein n=1 Tax=Corynebacterium sp. SCR221107 TaxID=3017361 RepID=UPI0022EC3CF2|nr:hypothetical protein [Corynebacterium sp. SCR221107]WBT09184.1 hypothetical protein PAB09_02265 [Corynebacterium sp. SCR221107]
MTAFMVRSQELSARGGVWAMLNIPSWMSLKSFEQLRKDLLAQQRISSLVHLGRGVFGSDFGTVAFVIDNHSPSNSRGVYRRLFEQHVDVRSIATIEGLFLDENYNRFIVPQGDFAAIPGSPVVYWLSEKMRAAFRVGISLGEATNLAVGLQTGNNDRFLRYWWEVSHKRTTFGCTSREEAKNSQARWFPYNKGGNFRKWYGNQEYVVNWENDGEEIRSFGTENGGRARSRAQNTETYFSSSVSWSKISSGAPAFRLFPSGFIYDVAGTSLFPDSKEKQLYLLAVLNSQVALSQLNALAPTMNFEVGQVASISITNSPGDEVETGAKQMIDLSRLDWNSSELSWDFEENGLITIARGAAK